jgi:asparagine synthase (glutamine-hydrolysing)
MCGITGFLSLKCNLSASELEEIANRMSDTISYRGPDDRGAWVDPEAGIAFGFRRLAILDLSPAGHQPMFSVNDRYVIIFNGEIYNFADLRQELANSGHSFRGHSDTEIMLAAICQWGLFAAVKRFNGMFAFALWDRESHSLHLVRDRLGIKPLYYGWSGEVFLFGSELKALKAHPSFECTIDRDALAMYLRYNCIHAPYSIYKGIRRLLPGTILTIAVDAPQPTLKPETYWSARQVVEDGVNHPFEGTAQEAIAELDRILRESINQRMIADVPLGAFLSGGIDSSTVVALMQAQNSRPVKTFTIGFHEADFDEARHAREVAQHLGTDHTELYVTPEEARAVIPLLPTLYDEPYSDSSQIPTYLVSRLARQYVTVSLSGDGGDELFAGYNRYFLGRKIWRDIAWIPRGIRRNIGGLLDVLSPRGKEFFAKGVGLSQIPEVSEKIRKLSNILSASSDEEMYLQLVTHWKDPNDIVIGGVEPIDNLTDRSQWAKLNDFTQRMMYLDLVTYLVDDILVKLDRASMAVSLEGRVPLLDDHRVVEFAWRLPLSVKVRNDKSKWILRQVLYQYVPPEMVERPKMGFAVPIGAWLRGPLRDWAESLLDENRLRQEGYFNCDPIRKKWLEHLSGKQNWQYHLWDILMFQAWLSANPSTV